MLTPAPKSGKHAALSEGLLASPVRSICSATTSCLRVSENEPSETVRKGARDGTGASILVVSSSEIELLGPVWAVCEASVPSFLSLFGQSLSEGRRIEETRSLG